MLRQLLSTNGVGPPGNASSSYYDQCSITYPSARRNIENSTVIQTLATSPPPQPIPFATGVSTTSQNQLRDWNDSGKNLAVLENVPLASYCTQASTASNQLETSNSNNDLNGTTELFSSTYAMLSADSSVSWNVWDDQTRFSNTADNFASNEMQMSMNRHSYGYPVHTTAPGCSSNTRFQPRNADLLDNSYMTNCQGLISTNGLDLQQRAILFSADDVGSRNYIQERNCAEKLNEQMTHARFSDSFREMTHVSVPAGQNYLDQMGGAVIENMRVTDSGNVTNANGIDPVCPYCDRFISHYKGNLRRHVNQCVKSMRNGSKSRRKDVALKQFTSDTLQFGGGGCNETIFSDSYQPHVLETSMGEKVAWMDGDGGAVVIEHETPKLKTYNVKKDRSNEEPFRCPLCDFATIYKGNMKRHLSTCHGLQDDDLKDGCIDKLKCKEPMDSRLENVSRGRRPKNMQYLRITPKSTQMDIEDGLGPSITDCNKLKSSDVESDAQLSAQIMLFSGNSSSKQEISLPVSSSDGYTSEEAGPMGSFSEMVKTSCDANSPLSKSNAIDETIEAVIANGNENSVGEMGANNYTVE